VVFRAGGTRPFVGGPASAIADLSIPLSQLWNAEADALVGRIAAGTAAMTLDRVEEVLLTRHDHAATGFAPLIVAVQHELRSGATIATVATRCAADRRALSTVFRREVGFGLKRYARLMRFERVLRAIRSPDAPSLGLLAAQFSFADQSHLTREFRYFAGMAPGRLHRVPGPSPVHVVHDEMFKTGQANRRTLRS
jgi:AraC-like DNA-binding protein